MLHLTSSRHAYQMQCNNKPIQAPVCKSRQQVHLLLPKEKLVMRTFQFVPVSEDQFPGYKYEYGEVESQY